MGTVTLLLGFHNHQPQGNFDHVFRRGYEDCYQRLLDAVVSHPGIKVTFHYSGPLIEWLEEHHPEHFDTLANLVTAGQVELMGGGFYEPMLSILPDRDATGQLVMMSEFIEARVGQRPRGLWLAERVWEPDLPRVIAAAGYRYTVLDDSHFLAAGMARPMRGYYVTDKAGVPLSVFPISMELRYANPFKPPREAVDLLLGVADEAGDGDLVVTYGDDGEKFGMWPGTRQWVWDEGWLDQFLSLLSEHPERIRTATFGEVLERQAPDGRVYLPTCSYDEMGHWPLPAEAQDRLAALNRTVEEEGHTDDWGPFVRGGIWQGFLARYPEANFMHKRMCHVSSRVARAAEVATRDIDHAGDDATATRRTEDIDHAGDDATATRRTIEQAARELYRGQCNCAYWHGLFGGLYLAKLRSAVHTHLIRADVLADELLGAGAQIRTERLDFDGDLNDEVILANRNLGLVVKPAQGGALTAIDDRGRAFCLTDVLTRQRESYHARVLELDAAARATGSGEQDTPRSIHDIAHLKDEGLAEILVYDPHQRLAFVDHFFAKDAELGRLGAGAALDLGDFTDAPYDLRQIAEGAGEVLLGRTGRVRAPGRSVDVSVQKRYRVADDGLQVDYDLTHEPGFPEGLCFATELSLALPSGPHEGVNCTVLSESGERRSHVTDGGVTEKATRLTIADPLGSTTVVLRLDPPATLVQFALQTASQSESGIERTYQGTTFVLVWPLPAPHSCFSPGLRLQLM